MPDGQQASANNASQPIAATGVIFDLDGVLAFTADLHYRSWRGIADALGIPFDRRANDRMRGLSRYESLAILLGDHSADFTEAQKTELTDRKNEEYLTFVDQMTPADLAPGALDLLTGLRQRGARLALASSSRNAARVIERLGVADLLEEIVDANSAPRSKPDPQVFLAAARRLAIPARRCVAIEDAEVGVEAALAAGMSVVGVGPDERVRHAHLVVRTLVELGPEAVLELIPEAG